MKQLEYGKEGECAPSGGSLVHVALDETAKQVQAVFGQDALRVKLHTFHWQVAMTLDLDAQANTTHYLTGLTGEDAPVGIADFFKQTLSSGLAAKNNRVRIFETVLTICTLSLPAAS